MIGHAAIILPGLIIGYFLLITNPPLDLLQYNENLKIATTYHLSGPDILNHLGSVFIFIAIFFLISTFLVFVTSRVLSGKKRRFFTDRFLTIVSIFVLGSITWPYYGLSLTVIMYSTGFMGALTAFLIYYPHTSVDYPPYFCMFAFSFYLCIWAIADFERSLAWILGLLALFLISNFSDTRREKLKERGLDKKGPKKFS